MVSQARSWVDDFASSFTKGVLKLRWVLIPLAIAAAMLAGFGGQRLEFANNYRVFFSEENPELRAFEDFQATYTKSDNVVFMIEPSGGDVFTRETLEAVALATREAWKLPYAGRVDSLTNFQYTHAEGDELIVEDLIKDPSTLTSDELARKREIALAEPLLNGQIVTGDSAATAVNIVFRFPEKRLDEVPVATAAVRALRDEIEQRFPGIDVSMTGAVMLNSAFSEAGQADSASIVPLMFAVITLLTVLSLRSVSATFSVIVVIMLSIAAAMGIAGWIGIKLTPPSISAPVIILTLAVADSLHIILTMRTAMRAGMAKGEAIVEAMRVNFLAVTITSLTTVVGFLALNFSDSPPFRDLGNITAMGVTAAWLFSIVLLPALLAFAPIRVKQRKVSASSRNMNRLGDLVVAHPRKWVVLNGTAALALVIFIPRIELSDAWREYFDTRIEFRRDTDKALSHFGFYTVELPTPAAGPGGVSDPDYLRMIDSFTEFLRAQPKVTHVYSLTDIMKRLNKNLHADNPSWYRIPEDRELSAQYLLLYELSLPYGLDLNDRINIDKSATRVTATLAGDTSTKEVKAFLTHVKAWLADNTPGTQVAPTSPTVMFAFIAQRNVDSMIRGTTLALLAIGVIMILALRSLSLGAFSIVGNAVPIVSAFGVWALLVGEVGFSVAAVASVAIGIVVDDTVHFFTKYQRGRREKGLNPSDAVRYAFETVGFAILVNTVILTIGFSVLVFSSFKINAELGLLTAITIVFALVFDFLFLPALLVLMGRERAGSIAKGAAHADAPSVS